MSTTTLVIERLLIPAVVMFFLVWSVVGAAIGAGLLVGNEATLRMMRGMNRYVSTRHAFKPLAMAHDIGVVVRRHRRLIGALFVLGASWSIYILATRFESSAIVAFLDLRLPRAFVVSILESVRWSLIVFNVLAVAVGAMLGFAPAALDRVEALANRWYSVRKHTVGADKMHLPLDRLVETYPRVAGSLIVVAALFVAANAALLWLRLS